jgi:hypothetical protein
LEAQAHADCVVDPAQWVGQIEREFASVRAALALQSALA